jgi:hypothetical protein
VTHTLSSLCFHQILFFYFPTAYMPHQCGDLLIPINVHWHMVTSQSVVYGSLLVVQSLCFDNVCWHTFAITVSDRIVDLKNPVVLRLFILSIFFDIEVWTQGFMLARQARHHLSHCVSPFSKFLVCFLFLLFFTAKVYHFSILKFVIHMHWVHSQFV